MKFSDYTSIDDMTKKAQVEVLLSYISVNSQGEPKVVPVRCPGQGRGLDIPMDEEGKPLCASGKGTCPYFAGADFEFESSMKRIFCGVSS